MPHEVAEKYLDEAEGLVEHGGAWELLLETLENAQKLNPDDIHILCRSARLLFRYGILNSKSSFFLLALEKLKLAAEIDPLYFDTYFVWWQLWGNVLIQLGKLIQDPALFELALEKFERANRVAHNEDPDLLWDWGEAWIHLGKKSGELCDFKQGINKLRLADKQGALSPYFKLDLAKALILYGQISGEAPVLEEAVSYLISLVTENYDPKASEPSLIYTAAWRNLAQGGKIRYQLTHRQDHFEEADRMIREGILSSPKNAELWLDWAELYLHAGWLRREVKLIETGLEKMTATKIKECEPLRVSFNLGFGLLLYGLHLENLKLIKEGKERIESALEVAPTHSLLRFGKALSELALGLYFGDAGSFSTAAALLTLEAAENHSADVSYALFQTYFAWGLFEQDGALMLSGLSAIKRVCELRPHSTIHLNEWGVANLRMRHFEEEREAMQNRIEEAILLFQKAWDLCEEEETLYNLGCAYDVLGDVTGDEEHYGKAIDLLSKALDKKPNNLFARYHLGLALSHLGELLGNADCLSQAIELLEPVAKIEKEEENIWNDLGYTLLNFAQAIDNPHHPEEAETKRSEAEKALLRAVELGSDDACYHLACLYSLVGLNEASLFYLRKAASVGSLPSKEDLEHDEWLDGVRETEAFQELLKMEGENG